VTFATASPPSPPVPKAQKKSDPNDNIGVAAHLVEETASIISIKGARSNTKQRYSIKELAKYEGCGFKDRCWPVGVSIKSYPDNLIFCTKKGQPDHTAQGAMHKFKAGFSQHVQQPPFRLP
jgi:hypothetical protein